MVLKAAGAILKRSLELWKSLGSLFPTLWGAWNGKGAFYENMLLARAGEWSGTSWGGLGAILSRLGAIMDGQEAILEQSWPLLGTLGVLLAALGATFERANGTKSVQVQAKM